MTEERTNRLLAGIFECELSMPRRRAEMLATGFADFEELFTLPKKKLIGPLSSSGKPILRLSAEDVANLDRLRKRVLRRNQTLAENYIAATARRFANRQVAMIKRMTLETLSANPLLVKALNIHTPKELVVLHVHMAATRSIVTSMGFFVEQLLWASSDDIEDAPSDSNWDFKVTRGGRQHWLQVKSGPNDIDKDQIVFWVKKIQEKLDAGDQAYIGITYGKKTADTVSLNLLKQYLPDWEMRVLVGHELWEFASGNPKFPVKLCKLLREAALTILHKASIVSELNSAVKRITAEFENSYGHGENAVERYVADIL